MKVLLSILLIVSTIFTLGCDEEESTTSSIAVGADQLEEYLPYLEGKRVGLVVNPTSRLNTGVHLIDAMIEEQVNVTTLFAPEHGLRGEQDAGEEVEDGIDPETGLPVISLYGDHKKPTEEDLQNVDVLVFDMQDVGIRFYTYISTMQLVMEAAAEYGRQVVILDRPNPNGSYIAGPIMEPEHVSFVGMAPIPVVHGLTIAELALMINGELWLSNGVFLDEGDLKVVKLREYSHSDSYSLPVALSPNLQTDESVIHYPSLGLFESTTISVGRGTNTPFEVIGYPDENLKINHEFQIADDSSAWPQQGQYVYGESYRIAPPENTKFSIEAFSRWYWAMRDLGYQDSEIVDRPEWLAQLIGTTEVLSQIRQGKPYQEIEASWQPELHAFSTLRETYRLYPD